MGRTVESLAEARAASGSASMSDKENADDLGSFGDLRGLRDRAIMLHVLGQKIRLRGRNLTPKPAPPSAFSRASPGSACRG